MLLKSEPCRKNYFNNFLVSDGPSGAGTAQSCPPNPISYPQRTSGKLLLSFFLFENCCWLENKKHLWTIYTQPAKQQFLHKIACVLADVCVPLIWVLHMKKPTANTFQTGDSKRNCMDLAACHFSRNRTPMGDPLGWSKKSTF